MARHRKLTQKFAGFPMFKLATGGDTFPLTSPFTSEFVGLDGLALDLQFATDKTFSKPSTLAAAETQITSRKGPSPVFTRGSGATFVDSDGLVKYGPENTILQSEDFGTSWSPDGGLIAVSTNVITSPFGLVNADKITENTTTTARRICIGSFVPAAGTVYTFSCYLKAGERNIAQLGFGGIFGNQYQNFIIGGASAGTLGNSLGVTSPQITALADGWYRCTATITSAGAGATQVTVGPLNADTALRWPTYVGTIGSGIYAWGAQVERFSTARIYIPTTTAAVYGPRFDHDPVTLACKGLLIEESRTNLLIQSEAFNDSASWSVARLVLQPVANTHVSPDGTMSAEKLTPSLATGDHRIDRPSISALIAGNVYTISVFVKSDGYTGFGINLGASPTPYGATFDLATGTVASTQVGWTASIQAYPNGWYRCTTTFTFSASTRLYFAVGSTGTTFSYVGDETSGILIWGAQVEAGLFPTSYIPTTTTGLTRSADVCSITGSDFSGMYNQPEGTLVTSSSRTSTNANAFIGHYSDNSFNNGFDVRYPSSTQVAALMNVANSNQVASMQVNITAGSVVKQAFSYKLNDCGYSVNGAATITDTSALIPTATRMAIGHTALASPSLYLNGTISSMRYFKKRLANAKLQTITV